MGFPFLWMIIGSFMNNKQIYEYPPEWIPRPFEFSNLVSAFELIKPISFLNSFIFTFGATIGIIFLCLLSAFVFARLRLPGSNILFMIYVASMMIPWQVLLIPQFVLIAKFGWVDTYQGLIIPLFAQLSVGTFFFRQFFLAVPKELHDAALIDGASFPRILFLIYIPLSKTAIMAFSTITALTVWKNLIWPLVATNTQDMRTVTVSLAFLSSAFGREPMGVILASSFLSIIPVLILYIVAQRKFIEGMATTGLKY